MEKNVQLFLILSLLLFLGTMSYMQKKYPSRRATAKPAPMAVSTPLAAGGATGAQAAMGAAQPTSGTLAQAAAPPAEFPVGPIVEVKTDYYDIRIATNGAVPIQWDIVAPEKFVTRTNDSGTTEPLREHMIDPALRDHPDLARPFQTVLQELGSRYYNEFNSAVFEHKQLDEAGLVHEFSSPANPAGIQMVKTYTFEKAGFQTKLNIELINGGKSNIAFGGDRGLGVILGPGLGGDSNGSDAVARYSSVDAAIDGEGGFVYENIAATQGSANSSTPGKSLTYDASMKVAPILWGGIVDKYFLAALIPDKANPISSAQALLDNRTLGTLTASAKEVGKFPQIELYTAPFTLPSGQKMDFAYTAYIGPIQNKMLKDAGHDLVRAMFHSSYNWMRSLCFMMLAVLYWMQSIFGNWGWAIMGLTLTVRLATLPFVHKGLKSQAKMTAEMSKIKPLIDKVNEKYKDDAQRKQQEIFKLYREHNINPLGMLKGCGWMMIQMPIFVGLYALLYQVIDLRGAHFLWIQDLSQSDRLFAFGFNVPLLGPYFNILPFIVAITQMLTSKFMQAPSTDPQQAQMQKMMTYMMPLMLLYFTYRFPSGLMLYWFVSNAWQVVQQIYVNKVIKKPAPAAVAA